MSTVGTTREYSAFARGLSQRHHRTASSARAVAMILRLRTATPTHLWHLTQQRLGISVGLRMPVTVRNDTQTTNVAAHYGALTTITRIHPAIRVAEAHTSLQIRQMAVPTIRRELRETHTRRTETVSIVDRSRVETHTLRFSGVDRHHRPVAVPLAVSRKAEARSAPTPPPPATAITGWESALPVPTTSTARPSVLAAPAPDIDRLTDRVVAAIDQRLIAHRERTGRGWA